MPALRASGRLARAAYMLGKSARGVLLWVAGALAPVRTLRPRAENPCLQGMDRLRTIALAGLCGLWVSSVGCADDTPDAAPADAGPLGLDGGGAARESGADASVSAAADKPSEAQLNDAGQSDAASEGAAADAERAATVAQAPRYRSEVEPVTSVEEAMASVFIPPFDDCREPAENEPAGMGPDGKVCTHVMISGCTEPGRYYPDYASCDVVRTQRPFWEAPPASEPKQDDPRLDDSAFMGELAWAKEQIEACACTCCHDSRVKDGKVGQWDINRGPIWLDTLSDSGLALFVGAADSSALGAYPAQDNYGFDRELTGIPTTDTARMQAFLKAELERRGISEEQARAVPPFGGPIYQNRIMEPVQCEGQGVDAQGRVQLAAAQARYIYVLSERADNPGVPPDQDLPDGTLWRLDVRASEPPLSGPLAYGSTPAGSFQVEPAASSAPELKAGTRYRLYALRDVGLPVINCIFTYGESLGEPASAQSQPPESSPMDGQPSAAESDQGAAGSGDSCGAAADVFGASCTDDSACACAPADYCALMPGQSEGYCTARGCKEDPSVCPAGWSCFDLSAFSADLPAICMKP